MLLSASALLLVTGVAQAATDVTPMSLAVRPNVVELGIGPYDWNQQKASRMTGDKLADQTANCNTSGWDTNNNGKTDEVHDCGFD